MKQVNIQLNLEDNQVFDKTVTDIIKGKVREIVRNECLDIVEHEVKIEAQRLFSGVNLGYRNKLSTMIKDAVRENLRSIISEMHVSETARQCVEECTEVISARVEREVEERCKEVLEKTITKSVEAKLKDILS